MAMALALAEEIAVLKNRIALYESDSEAAKVNGNEAMQRLLLATITATRNNLLHLEKRLEKQGNRNQSAMSMRNGSKALHFLLLPTITATRNRVLLYLKSDLERK